jgi:replicative DNA helicase
MSGARNAAFEEPPPTPERRQLPDTSPDGHPLPPGPAAAPQADERPRFEDTVPEPLAPIRAPATFPVDALPSWAGAYVRALATATQTPADLAGCVVLGVLAACAGGRVQVEARDGWREPTNLFLLPVLPPGSRKSAVVSAATRPLYDAEGRLIAKAAPAVAEAAMFRDVEQKTADSARDAAARAKSEDQRRQLLTDAISAQQRVDEAFKPFAPRLVADDVTPEAVGTLLSEHGGRLAIMSAEGGAFDIMAGRYSPVPSLDVFLKGHAGDTLRVDRRGRPPEYIHAPALTMLLTVQPSVLDSLNQKAQFRGRGLLARFLYALPADNVGHRLVGADPVPRAVTAAYATQVVDLAEGLADWTDPAILQLNPAAQAALLEAERRIEPTLAPDRELGGVRDWGSKLAGAIVRLAGLLHLAEHGTEGWRHPITADTLHAAVTLGGYFSEHARAAFGAVGPDAAGDPGAEYLWEHLGKQGIQKFKVRDLFTALPRGRYAKTADLNTAINILVDHGWLMQEPSPPRKASAPGRPPSPTYLVHPAVHAAEPAQAAKPAHASLTSADGATGHAARPRQNCGRGQQNPSAEPHPQNHPCTDGTNPEVSALPLRSADSAGSAAHSENPGEDQ